MEGLLFITHQTESIDYLRSMEIALEGGCKHIQLRMKGASIKEVEDVAHRAKALCDRFDALLYIDDHAEVCKKTGAQGVHLGKADMPPAEARRMLGDGFIIGGTANTLEDVAYLYGQGVDYIGLGPFRFTTTKKNLSPVLGLEGYGDILGQCRERGIRLPVFAIGGITADDIPDILRTGVAGVALSSAILTADNPADEIRKILRIIRTT
ncbi:Thiamine-phosphate synthase [Bacteroidales bacterium Barb6]|nr:Thiamine-phosphate synthase [Bacteroidales bacterium Barb6]